MNIMFLKEKCIECSTKLDKGTVYLYMQKFLTIYEKVKRGNKRPRELLKEFQYAEMMNLREIPIPAKKKFVLFL